jgi:hypothetical protein
MEGFALILIGAAIFSHAWYLLGLYSEGRTVGVLMAALGAALLITLTFEPQLLGLQGTNGVQQLGELTMMKSLIVLWAAYALVVAAQGWWDLEERAIGFYAVVLVVGSAVAVAYFATQLWEHDALGGVSAVTVTASLTGVSSILTVVGATLFFYMALPSYGLRMLAGWFSLVGSIGIIAVGLAIITTLISY